VTSLDDFPKDEFSTGNLPLVDSSSSAMPPKIEVISNLYLSMLAEVGSYLDLRKLEIILASSRERAKSHPELVAEHYRLASVIMKGCPHLFSVDIAVKVALSTGCFEVLRCLAHRSVWTDSAQKHWFWSMIYGTVAFDQSIWDLQEFDWPKYWDTIFATDNVGLYTTISKMPFMESLSKS
jgi:hypothetical protein